MAYMVAIDATEPGARIEVNGAQVGNTPLNLKLFADKDGTFHDFGSYFYIVRAWPVATNQFVQTAAFRTGRWFTPEDRVPQRIHFDMNQRTPAYAPVQTPGSAEPVYGPPFYYAPWYYSPPWVYGPGVHVYYQPRN
jgi:hypothetical protein